MMGRRDRDRASLFHDFNFDDVIPENHLRRRFDVFVRTVLTDVNEQFNASPPRIPHRGQSRRHYGRWDDIYGDGVNMAARLNRLQIPAVAGSVTVREHIGSKVAVDFEDFGRHLVKNLERPVRVHTLPAWPSPSCGLSCRRTSWR